MSLVLIVVEYFPLILKNQKSMLRGHGPNLLSLQICVRLYTLDTCGAVRLQQNNIVYTFVPLYYEQETSHVLLLFICQTAVRAVIRSAAVSRRKRRPSRRPDAPSAPRW